MKRAAVVSCLRVGVTGGIGSGKTTVCRAFAILGRHVISADELAHCIAEEDESAKRLIRKEFGLSSYLADGRLDRKGVAAVVFNDQNKRQKLDSIIHPRVFKAIDEQLASLSNKQLRPYVLIEAALIYETGMQESLDYVIVVTADREACITRVVGRDHVAREDVVRRIQAQMPVEKKAKLADFVIENNGPDTNLLPAVKLVDTILVQTIATRTP
ncbi:MAG: dephospho-CoA kinase [Bacteroidota bacterium]